MKKKSQTKTKRPRKRTSKKKRTSNVDSMLTSYANLVANPCHGPLVRLLGPSPTGSLVERLRRTLTLPAAAASVNGYVVIYPSFHNSGAPGYNAANNFYFEANSTAVAPINTVANPAGSGGTSGSWIVDPAYSVLAGTGPFARAKCLSACVQVEYLGALSAIQGQVAVVSNYSLSALNTNTGAVTTAFGFPTVDQVFAYAAVRERMQLEGHEAIWRPSADQSKFRGTQVEESGAAATSLPDAAFWAGSAGVQQTNEINTEPSEVLGMCIAWRGIPAVANVLSINVVKAVELELAARNGQIEEIPTPPTTSASAQGYVQSAINLLDRNFPNWQRRLITQASRYAIQSTFAPRGAATASAGIRGMIVDATGNTSHGRVGGGLRNI